ncbi:hypothetical protein IV203_018739 [Nitzschia inconspicua]|uniref:Uncharacterized protein n=1 Tax=Nitzschia inconspicua TaxID=303405 RepID=A0A9K3Q6M9_9STRA|nr:hypothetical protein IV203_018739 [Nitzschia inconspicua]
MASVEDDQEAKLQRIIDEALSLGLEYLVEYSKEADSVDIRISVLERMVEMEREEIETKRNEAQGEAGRIRQKDRNGREYEERIRKQDRGEEAEKHVCAPMNFAYRNIYGQRSPFKPPPALLLNEAVIPSCPGHSRTVTIMNELGNTETHELEIPTVIYKESEGEMWLDPATVTIPNKSADGEELFSFLGLTYVKAGRHPFEYGGVFDVRRCCHMMIVDALAALGLDGTFATTQLDTTPYMMTHDLVWLIKFEGRTMFVVEVKSPEHGENQVFGDPSVGGQMWSYLNGMKASGMTVPMGAIMTYHKIAIVSLEDCSTDQGHSLKVVKTKDALSSGKAGKALHSYEELQCEERKENPKKVVPPLTEDMQEDTEKVKSEEGAGTNAGDDKIRDLPRERILYSSKVYECEKVFPCLLQALHLAYQYARETSAAPILRINNGEAIGNRLAFKVGPLSLDWVKIEGKVRAKVNNQIPDKHEQCFFFLGPLGLGSKAWTYLGCSESAQVCAIKDYFSSPSFPTTVGKRMSDYEGELSDDLEGAYSEQERWAFIYKDRFTTRVTYLGGKPSLIMPYGYELSSPEDQWKYLPEIRDEVLRFAELGYIYEYGHLQWQHVLLDSNDKIFFCDLESLEKFRGDVNEEVYKQLYMLFEPHMSDIDLPSAFEWVTNALEDVSSFVCRTDTLFRFIRDDTMTVTDILVDLFPRNESMENLTHRAKVVLAMLGYFKATMMTQAKSVVGQEMTEAGIPKVD